MFHYDHGLRFTDLDLGVDMRRRQPRGFISHAHADHMARHELAYCTPTTALLYQHRLGPRPTRLMPYQEVLQWNEYELTTHPAGHVLGSAMLRVCGNCKSVLYTGDFKLRPSLTAEAAQPPRSDVLIMESTYGQPSYRLPPREETIAQLLSIVSGVLATGRTPVVRAYALGKSQEVTKILTSHGLPVVQHPLIYAVSRIYQQCGCDLGPVQECLTEVPEGAVVIAPPRQQRASSLAGLRRPVSIGVSGWAVDPGWRWRQGMDYAVPLSDHADFDELVECIERVEPSVIYCTHGPAEFVAHLRTLGHNAHPLENCHAGQPFQLCRS